LSTNSVKLYRHQLPTWVLKFTATKRQMTLKYVLVPTQQQMW